MEITLYITFFKQLVMSLAFGISFRKCNRHLLIKAGFWGVEEALSNQASKNYGPKKKL